MTSLDAFKQSRKGTRLASLFSSDDAVRRMIAKSEAGRPAVEALGKDIAQQVGPLSDEEKKLVGRWAKEILEPMGWVPDRKGRVASGNFFNRGTIYRRRRPVHVGGDGQSRLSAAQAVVAKLSRLPMTSAQLIEERRRDFEQER